MSILDNKALREAIDTAMYDIREYNVRKDSHELTHNQAVDLILSALQANEVKRPSNPVDDGAVERAYRAYHNFGPEVVVTPELYSFQAMRRALEAAEPHP